MTDPLKPPALTVEGVPHLPRNLRQTLARYQQARGASFYGWAPDGHGVLIGTRFGNTAQLHRVYEPGGRREQLTFFEEPTSGFFIPKAKDGAIIFTLDEGGNENYQLFLFESASGRISRLTDGKSRNSAGPITLDGARMVLANNGRNGRDTDLYLGNPRQPGSFQPLMETSAEYWVPTDWSHDGNQLAMIRWVSINESHPALFDIASKKLTPLPTFSDKKTSVGSLHFSPEGDGIYFTSDAQGEFRQLGYMDLKTQRVEWISTPASGDAEDVVVDHDSQQVGFTINEDGVSRLFVLKHRKLRELPVPMGIIGNLEFSPDGKEVGFSLWRPTAPGDVYSMRVKDLRMTRWTYSEIGGLNPEHNVEPRLARFPSFDGRNISAYVFEPPHASKDHPVPVVIDIHGGPESQYRPYFNGVHQFYIQELGIAVVCPNVRGSTGYGKTFTMLDNGRLREDSVKDIGALLDWIATNPRLDAKQVAVTGGSYGGYMVLGSLVHFGERLKAGVDIVGISNFVTFLEKTSPYRQDLRRVEYGDERDPAMRAFLESISPANNAHKIRSALFVIHGVNDPRVPFAEARQIADAVRAKGHPVWTLYGENEGHGFSKKDNRDYAAAMEARFFIEFLLDGGKNAPPHIAEMLK